MSVERSALNVARSAPRGAVFLSYASQDAEAVERIAAALRAAGVEVWFDQNELVGGDAWDQKIRGQIKSCALFVPIISAATNARREGYFRREWKLAVDRTHDMDEALPFLVPVVIDATTDAGAFVPEKFREVQWTRLPGGETPEKFCERVKKLLGGENVAQGSGLPAVGAALDDARGRGRATPLRKPFRWWLVPAMLGVAAVAITAIWQPWKRLVVTSASVAPPPVDASASAAPLFEARKLVAQARALVVDGDQTNHENFFLAEDLLKRALTLDPADGEVWAAQAQLSSQLYYFNYDRSSARREAMRVQAERAVKLAPDSFEAQLAMADFLALGGASSATEAVPLLNRLAERAPNDRRVYQALGEAYSYGGKIDDAAAAFHRGNAVPGGDPEGVALLAGQFLWYGRYAEMGEAIAQALAVRPVGRALIHEVIYKLIWLGDLDGAAAALARWPAWLLREDRGAFVASQVWMWRREPEKAVEALNRLTHDFINESIFVGPKAGLLALAQEMAQHPQAARSEWENTRNAAGRVVADDPANKRALAWKAIALARLGETKEANAILNELEQIGELRADYWSSGSGGALLRIAVGRGAEVAAKYDLGMRSTVVRFPVPSPQAALRLNPVFDPIRATPEFQKWLAAAPAPKAKEARANAVPARGQKSVAVLAFANLSDDKDNEYFSDGISEELLNVLGRVPGLRVAAPMSAFYFKGKNVPAQEIGQKLNVAYLVNGSVRRAGTTVRVVARLSRADTDEQIWTATFDGTLDKPWALQEKIAGQIAQALQVKLGATAQAARSVNPEAYGWLLQGRFFARQESNAGWKQSIDFFRQAVGLEPGYAAAWAELAQSYIRLARFGGMMTADGIKEARRAAQKSLELDPDQLIALDAMGWVQRTADWDWRAAQKTFQRALSLAPENSAVLADAAILYFNVGRVDEAVALARQAAERDPLNAMAQFNLADLLMQSGGLAESVEIMNRGIKLAPQVELFRSHLAVALMRLKRFAEADALVEQEPNEAYRLWGRGIIAGLRGDRAAVTQAREALMAKQGSNITGSVAMLYIAEGNHDEAFAWLERSFVERDSTVCWVKTALYYEPLRSDVRWPVFLRKLGLADEQLK